MKRVVLGFAVLLGIISKGNAQCWQQVSPGTAFSMGIKSDGTLWAWGLNDHGQLGIGSTINQLIPVQVGTSNDWQMVAAGNDQVHAIKTDGTIWAWGYNTFGQLGLGGGNLNITSPEQMGTDNTWQYVSAGSGFSMAIKTDGTLWGWGNNFNGQIGIPGQNNYITPQQIGTATDWQTVSAGFSDQTLAVKTNGTLWVCGDNTEGQLGTGDNISRNTLTQVGAATNWQTVEATYNRSYAIKTDGTIWGWGRNDAGQLGNGNNIASNAPVQEVTMATNWVSISCGQLLSLAKKTDGSLWSWGYGPNGENFIATNTPEQAGTATDWSSIYIYWNHTLAIKTDNTLWAWGDGNDYGELGNGTTVTSYTPVQVSCSVILPVTWLFINGKLQNNNAIIEWATASENNSSHFEIEHSSNGLSFTKTGAVNAAGNSSTRTNYSFTHSLPVVGKNYYRIKQIDLDGRFTYSRIVTLINNHEKNSIVISPNPALDFILLNTNTPATATIRIYSMQGEMLQQQQIPAGNQQQSIDISKLPAGMYSLHLQTSEGMKMTSFIKH